jgi:hypothetical protein
VRARSSVADAARVASVPQLPFQMRIDLRHRLLLLGMIVLAGCAGLESKSRLEQFDNLTRGYAKALTWSNFDVAYSATKAAQETPLPDAAALKDIKVTSYDPAAPLVEPNGKTIKRVARIRYVHTSRMTERSLTMEEEWQYSDEAGRWFLLSGFPQFK